MELSVSGHSCLGRSKRENEPLHRVAVLVRKWTWKGFANIWIFVCDWIEKWKKILSFSFLDSFYFHSCDIFLFFLMMWNFEVTKMVSWYFLMFLQVYNFIFGGNRILFKKSTKGLSKSCFEILEFPLSFSPPSSSKCCWTSLKNLINWFFSVSPKLLSLNIATRESGTLVNFPSLLYTKLASTPLNSMYWLAPNFSTRSSDLSALTKP